MERVILHCDLNNFYASVECLHHPEYRHRPLAVGGDVEKRHGIILAKNGLAKAQGVQTGEAIWQALNKCPDLLVVKPNFTQYLRFSRLVRTLYAEYTDRIESFGIDEAWLDVSDSLHLFHHSPVHLADELRQRIKAEFGITASIGVSFNKIFAKLGSDYKKPDATTLITRDNMRDLVFPLPVSDLLYVGPATRAKLQRMGVYTIGDLAQFDLNVLKRRLGKWGWYLWRFANGYDETPVGLQTHQPLIKSIGNSTTSPKDLRTLSDVKIVTYVLAESVAARLKEAHLCGRTLSVYVRDVQLKGFVRQSPLSHATQLSDDLAHTAMRLFEAHVDWSQPLRSIGLKVSQLEAEHSYQQLDLFHQTQRHHEALALERTIETIRQRYGFEAIQRCMMVGDRLLSGFNPKQDHVIFPEAYFKG
jgi:DNA polymerase-4